MGFLGGDVDRVIVGVVGLYGDIVDGLYGSIGYGDCICIKCYCFDEVGWFFEFFGDYQ